MKDIIKSAQILPFNYPRKPGRWSDKQRILELFSEGKISEIERNAWLKNGGHV